MSAWNLPNSSNTGVSPKLPATKPCGSDSSDYYMLYLNIQVNSHDPTERCKASFCSFECCLAFKRVFKRLKLCQIQVDWNHLVCTFDQVELADKPTGWCNRDSYYLNSLVLQMSRAMLSAKYSWRLPKMHRTGYARVRSNAKGLSYHQLGSFIPTLRCVRSKA